LLEKRTDFKNCAREKKQQHLYFTMHLTKK
jgi:hypothetical protein